MNIQYPIESIQLILGESKLGSQEDTYVTGTTLRNYRLWEEGQFKKILWGRSQIT